MSSEHLLIFLVFIVLPILLYGFFLVRAVRDQDRLKRFTFVSSVVFGGIPVFSVVMAAFYGSFELETLMPIRFSDFTRTTQTLVLGLYFAAMAFAVRKQGIFAVITFWGLITGFNLFQLIIYGNMYIAWKPF